MDKPTLSILVLVFGACLLSTHVRAKAIDDLDDLDDAGISDEDLYRRASWDIAEVDEAEDIGAMEDIDEERRAMGDVDDDLQTIDDLDDEQRALDEFDDEERRTLSGLYEKRRAMDELDKERRIMDARRVATVAKCRTPLKMKKEELPKTCKKCSECKLEKLVDWGKFLCKFRARKFRVRRPATRPRTRRDYGDDWYDYWWGYWCGRECK